MKLLVTGAKGFVGRNLCETLKNIRDGKDRTHSGLLIDEVMEYDIDTDSSMLDEFCQKADFVFNLAGVNRPKDNAEFMQGNFGFASQLLDTLKRYDNHCPVMISSSIQAALDNPYGESKRAGEQLMREYGIETGSKVLIYRFPNVFGKWCRPNYNSAVATFCHNIAHELPIKVNDPSVMMHLVYIDDVVDELVAALQGNEHHEGDFCVVPVSHKITLGEIVEWIHRFHDQPAHLTMPEIPAGSFEKKLYSTYLSYLPKGKVAFPLKMNVDERGSFTELLKTAHCGQFSVNISKPGITKGQHWHNTKWEFFIVVSGKALIQERCISPSQPSPQGRAQEDKPYNTADPTLYKLLKEKAESMRNSPTEAESVMWKMLKGKNLDAKFRRQHIIGDYIVDFVCLDNQLIVEVDGGYHNDPEQKDLNKQRTMFLQSKGFSVLRFTNEEVLCNTDETLGVISNALKYLSPHEGGVGEGPVLNWFVSGDKIEAVTMLPGYTHNIINLSDTEDLVTLMWANEQFDPSKPDTFFEKV